jgi:alpha-tubulin suppressor-like RCC1 family protein
MASSFAVAHLGEVTRPPRPAGKAVGGPPLRGVRVAHLSWLGALLALGCSEELQVLLPADAGPDTGLADAGREPPDAAAERDSGSPACDCAAVELCTPLGCVEHTGARSIAANLEHTCLVKNGRLFCFGKNSSGQLGVGDRAQRELPTRVGATNDWLRVAVGEGHSCGLRAPGTLHCWGENALGQLGLGDTEPRLTPVQVGALDDWEALACGGANCCAHRAGGTMYCWGDNLEGKPAQDDPYGEPDVLEPRPAATDVGFDRSALGQGHACAIGVEGDLYCWGRNILGETGTAPGVSQLRVPTLVAAEDSDWSSVAAAQHHSCGVREDGSLWCWGKNTHQQLGLPPAPDGGDEVLTPAQVGSEQNWASAGAGWFHTCALARDGVLSCMGRSLEGQLAQPPGEPIGTLLPVTGVESVDSMALGSFHTCAIADLVPYCWGENTYGQLGVGDVERRYVPTEVPVP